MTTNVKAFLKASPGLEQPLQSATLSKSALLSAGKELNGHAMPGSFRHGKPPRHVSHCVQEVLKVKSPNCGRKRFHHSCIKVPDVPAINAELALALKLLIAINGLEDHLGDWSQRLCFRGDRCVIPGFELHVCDKAAGILWPYSPC